MHDILNLQKIFQTKSQKASRFLITFWKTILLINNLIQMYHLWKMQTLPANKYSRLITNEKLNITDKKR